MSSNASRRLPTVVEVAAAGLRPPWRSGRGRGRGGRGRRGPCRLSGCGREDLGRARCRGRAWIARLTCGLFIRKRACGIVPRTSSLGVDGSTPKRVLNRTLAAVAGRRWPLRSLASSASRPPCPPWPAPCRRPRRRRAVERQVEGLRRARRGSGRRGAGSGSSRRTGSGPAGWRSSGPRADRPGCSGSSGRASGCRSPPAATASARASSTSGALAVAVGPDVVDRVVERLAHQGVPDPVDERPGEPGVVLAGDVRRRQLAPLGRRSGRRGPARRVAGQEEPGRDRDLLLRVLQVGHRVARACPAATTSKTGGCPCSAVDPPRPGARRRTRRTRGTARASRSRSGGRGTGRTGSARPGRSARPRRPSRPAAPRAASAKPTAPFSSFRPVAVISSVAISSQGAFLAICSASQSSSSS